MNYVDIPSYEKIAFIAYNIGVYESIQKFGGLITSGKIIGSTDASNDIATNKCNVAPEQESDGRPDYSS